MPVCIAIYFSVLLCVIYGILEFQFQLLLKIYSIIKFMQISDIAITSLFFMVSALVPVVSVNSMYNS